MLNTLKKPVYEKMDDTADLKEEIIFENYEVNEKHSFETYIVIVEIPSNRFRIYQGMLHFTGTITVKFMMIDSDMLEAMKNTLGLKIS